MGETLFLIPARGGSKGIPRKNIKPLNGLPLIHYSINFARQFTSDDHICVSTDSDEIIEVVRNVNLEVLFKRPDFLSTDFASTSDVVLHALNFYKENGSEFKNVALLQPTSPIRNRNKMAQALKLMSSDLDMVASFHITKSNPYFLLFKEKENGLVEKFIKDQLITRRQDAPEVFELNGNFYVINAKSLKKSGNIGLLSRVKPVLIEEIYSLDLDTQEDWDYCEYLIKKYPELLEI